jgi:hypothetical protein
VSNVSINLFLLGEELMFTKLFVVGTVVILSGCNKEEINTEDFSTDPAVCVDDVVVTYKDGMDINVVDMTKEYLIVEEYVNTFIDKYYPAAGHVNIETMFHDYPISVHYTNSLDNRGEFHIDSDEIVIDYPAADVDVVDACIEKYYILGHELLHYIAKYHLNVSDDNNRAHNVVHMFFYNATNDVDIMDTAEWYIYMDTVSICVMEQ